ncbi:FAD-dependent oxidoreductase [Streptomyces sp. NPDC001493]
MPSDDNSFGFVFCGGGPAALGPIVTASRSGRLDALLDRGIALVEPGPIGPGGLAHYRISANSLGGPFMECLDGLEAGTPLAALRDLPVTRRLRALADEHPPLSVVAPFLARLGEVVAGLLEAHPRCAVVRQKVTGIDLCEDGVRVSTDDGRELTAQRTVIATGGRPRADFAKAEIVPGLSLAPHQDRVRHSESFVDTRKDDTGASGKVVVVGGSHSAWSVVHLLLPAADEITVIHRTGLRLFYDSADRAGADGYVFDPVLDVCPMNGRVNRYGGLRGRAHELARAALRLPGSDPLPVRLVQVDTPAARDAAAQALAEADTIVMANGFEADLPPIHYADGMPFTAATGPTGTVVNDRGHLVDARGTAYPQLVAYGLGAGLAPSQEVGGEPSYTRRADGVWLYQHDIGEVVLDDLLNQVTTEGETQR